MTMKKKPRNRSLPVTAGSPALTNCGRKVMKNITTFGFRMFTEKPVATFESAVPFASVTFVTDRLDP